MWKLPGSIVAVAVAGLGLVPGSAAAQEATFTSSPDLTFGNTATIDAVAVGDLNSDGRQDLVATDFSGDRAIARLGNGDGTFRDGGEIAGASRPVDIAIGDFNADGTDDVALAAGTSPTHSVVVHRGRGDGTFSFQTAFTAPAGGVARSIAVADYNSDGREDLAVAAFSRVSVHLAAANGTFAVAGEAPLAEPYPGTVASGDFDGNGHEDVAVTLNGQNTAHSLGILPGKGDGHFQPLKTTPVPNRTDRLAVGDFNGDAKDDLAASVALEDRVAVRLGRGDGTFSDDVPDVGVGDRPSAVAVGDLDSDGREDLAVSNLDDDNVSLRLGNGDGSFRDSGNLAAGDLPAYIAIGDLNSDGNGDLAVANHSGRSVSVRLGSGTPPLAGNLLANGGFEQGLGARLPNQSPAIPGWATTGGMTFVRYGANPRVGFPSWLEAPRFGTGGNNFLWGGDSTGLGGITTASQTVDVPDSAEAIDGGRATANLSAYLGGARDHADHMTATAEFLTGDGTSTGTLTIGPVTREDRGNVTTLLRRAGSALLPAGTRRIRVTLTSTDTDTVSSAIADNVKLTLEVAPVPEAAPAQPPVPEGGGDQAPQAAFGADTKVTVNLAASRIGAKGPVSVRLSNGNAFGVTGTLSARTAAAVGARRKPVALAAKRFTVNATNRTTARLALSKTLRRELARKRKLALRLSVVVQDPAGNRRTVAKRVTVRLKPRRAR